MRRVSTRPVPEPEVPYSALIGQLLKAYRVRGGVHQETLAVALGLSQSAYSRLESGDTNITAWQLRVCAAQLGLVPSRILAEVEAYEGSLRAQGVKVVAEKKTNPVAALVGLALLAALLSS